MKRSPTSEPEAAIEPPSVDETPNTGSLPEPSDDDESRELTVEPAGSGNGSASTDESTEQDDEAQPAPGLVVAEGRLSLPDREPAEPLPVARYTEAEGGEASPDHGVAVPADVSPSGTGGPIPFTDPNPPAISPPPPAVPLARNVEHRVTPLKESPPPPAPAPASPPLIPVPAPGSQPDAGDSPKPAEPEQDDSTPDGAAGSGSEDPAASVPPPPRPEAAIAASQPPPPVVSSSPGSMDGSPPPPSAASPASPADAGPPPVGDPVAVAPPPAADGIVAPSSPPPPTPGTPPVTPAPPSELRVVAAPDPISGDDESGALPDMAEVTGDEETDNDDGPESGDEALAVAAPEPVASEGATDAEAAAGRPEPGGPGPASTDVGTGKDTGSVDVVPMNVSDLEERPPVDPVMVRGVRCPKCGAHNHPDARYCAQDGKLLNATVSGSVDEDGNFVLGELGPRPPLGQLTRDDGVTITVDRDLVLGRAPSLHQRVSDGEAWPVTLPDQENSISRIHAEVALDDWQAFIVDAGSRNGTYVRGADTSEWTKLPDGERYPLENGLVIAIGDRRLTYNQHHVA